MRTCLFKKNGDRHEIQQKVFQTDRLNRITSCRYTRSHCQKNSQNIIKKRRKILSIIMKETSLSKFNIQFKKEFGERMDGTEDGTDINIDASCYASVSNSNLEHGQVKFFFN